eukprot:scaffold75692_cov35-Prasinocladus_malaysianus.AAC.2
MNEEAQMLTQIHTNTASPPTANLNLTLIYYSGVVAVDLALVPPAYTVHVDGQERQTEGSRLTPILNNGGDEAKETVKVRVLASLAPSHTAHGCDCNARTFIMTVCSEINLSTSFGGYDT